MLTSAHNLNSTRLIWLVRRLSRMYWQEVPFRAHSVLRGLAQGRGLFTAKRVPPRATDARYGRAWLAAPEAAQKQAGVLEEAERLLAGDFAVFGEAVAFVDGVPDWNRDPVTRQPIPLTFGLFIDFRHVGEGIDIKHLWELNRHVWWVTLAQAWALTKDSRYLQRIERLLDSWLQSCPYALGPNWTSPVEHGIRLINWSLVWHLIGAEQSPIFQGQRGQQLLARWEACIYQHMRFASDNYSYYSSADNHLIGEAAGVYVAAQTWDLWPEGRKLCVRANELLESETLKQFAADGVNLEQALCYHKFTLQFLLASALSGQVNGQTLSPAYWQRIEAAIVFLAAVTDVGGNTPGYGDTDDGEVWSLGAGETFNTYHAMVALGGLLFERGDLIAKSGQLGDSGHMELSWLSQHRGLSRSNAAPGELPTFFETGGYALLGHDLHSASEFRVLFDCGPLGYNRISGHGHADVLSLQLAKAGEALLVDAGTYCYNAAPELRHFFRGTAAHNTVAVDGQDQSIYGASFLWLRDIATTIEHRDVGQVTSVMHAHHDGYLRLKDPVRHHRRVTVGEGDWLEVEDWLECKQSHEVSVYWHAAAGTRLLPDGNGAWALRAKRHRLSITVSGPQCVASIVEGQDAPPQGWVSTAFYSKTAAPVLVLKAQVKPGEVLRTRIQLSDISAA